MKHALHLGFAIIALGGCQTTYEAVATEAGSSVIAAPSGQIIGAARIFSLDGKSTINVSLNGASPGIHKVSLQQATSCAGIAHAMASAGPVHRRVSSADHSLPAQLPDIFVAQDGVGTMSARLVDVFLSNAPPIAQNMGTIAIVLELEESASNTTSSGRGGDSACGVFTPSR